MPGIFDGFAFGIFDDAIFDTKIQQIPTTARKMETSIPAKDFEVAVP